MKHYYLLIACFAIGLYFPVQAQEEFDLNELRQAPPTNALPVRVPAASLRDVDIQAPSLDLKINYWRNWTTFSITANQATFSENFVNGGVNSISIAALFNTKWDYTRDNQTFVSELDLRYGKLRNQDQLARKNQDRIWWDNKYSYKFSRKWGFFGAVTFESQFDRGFQYETTSDGRDSVGRRISNFLAPGYLTQSLGIEYKPDQFSSIRFGTGTLRQTFVMDNAVRNPSAPAEAITDLQRQGEVRFGIPYPGRFRNELAFQVVAMTDRDLTKSLHLKAQYEFFANYEEWSNARHRLDVILNARVSRVISVLFNTTLLYDPLQIPPEMDGNGQPESQTFSDILQRSQLLGIGITYKFPR